MYQKSSTCITTNPQNQHQWMRFKFLYKTLIKTDTVNLQCRIIQYFGNMSWIVPIPVFADIQWLNWGSCRKKYVNPWVSMDFCIKFDLLFNKTMDKWYICMSWNWTHQHSQCRAEKERRISQLMTCPKANWCQESANLSPINETWLKMLVTLHPYQKKYIYIIVLPKYDSSQIETMPCLDIEGFVMS